jgi:hypothetical protein
MEIIRQFETELWINYFQIQFKKAPKSIAIQKSQNFSEIYVRKANLFKIIEDLF